MPYDFRDDPSLAEKPPNRDLLKSWGAFFSSYRDRVGRRSYILQILLALYSTGIWGFAIVKCSSWSNARDFRPETISTQISLIFWWAVVLWLPGLLSFSIAAVVTLKEPDTERDDRAERSNGSTPHSGENYARHIRREVDGCPHSDTGKAESNENQD